MPETTTMPETAQDQQTTTGTDRPEHHQTQAATGSPQAASASTGSTAGNASMTGSQTGAVSGGGRPSTGMSRRGGLTPASLLGDPFGMMRSMMDQMDRLFGDFMGGGTSQYRQPGTSQGLQGTRTGSSGFWYPQVEVSQREGNLVVCADLPGLRREDVQLEIHDDYLVLQGERRSEQEENQGGLYRSERSYGRFFRTIPLPEGTNPDQARANFKDGVLEITVPLPTQEQRQGRRIEIQ